MQADRIRMSADEGRLLAERVLRTAGYSEREAWIIGDHVIEAALCGYEYSGLPKILNVIEKAKASGFVASELAKSDNANVSVAPSSPVL